MWNPKTIVIGLIVMIILTSCALASTPPTPVYAVSYANAESLKGELCEYNDTQKIKYCIGVKNPPQEHLLFTAKVRLENEETVRKQIVFEIEVEEFKLRSYHFEAGVVTTFTATNVKGLKLKHPAYLVRKEPMLASKSNPNLACFAMPVGTRSACTNFVFSSQGTEESTVVIDWWNMVQK